MNTCKNEGLNLEQTKAYKNSPDRDLSNNAWGDRITGTCIQTPGKALIAYQPAGVEDDASLQGAAGG